MEARSGQPVVVSDVPVPGSGATERPVNDLDRLISYISGRFADRDRELVTLHRNARSLKLKGDVVELGFEAIDFRRELSGWIAFARRLRETTLADAMRQSHEEHTQEAEERDLKRANAKLVETRAKANVAPLNEAIERLEAARTEMDTTISWCQSLQRSISNEEYGDMFESGNEAPTQMYQAPIGAALKQLSH